MQNYYEITNALLRLEHGQKPVDVGGLIDHFFVFPSPDGGILSCVRPGW